MENNEFENVAVINTEPTPEAKTDAVRDLGKQTLKYGILSQVIPAAATLPVVAVWLVWYFITLFRVIESNQVFEKIFSSIAVLMLLACLCMIPGIILGRIAWKRGNLARAGAIDVGILNPPKAIVGKILGIVAFFSGIASIVIFLYDGLLFGGIGLFAGKLF